MADVATVLFSKFLKFDPTEPHWPDRDRFILSAGHGSMLLYSLLYLTGYPDMTLDEIKHFRQLGSQDRRPSRIRPRHRHRDHDRPARPGHRQLGGLRARRAAFCATRFGADVVDHFTYVIAGDGCLMEGIGQEAVTLAGHLGLGRLIVLFDNNSISIDGPTSLADVGRPHEALRRRRLARPGGRRPRPGRRHARHPQGAQGRRTSRR